MPRRPSRPTHPDAFRLRREDLLRAELRELVVRACVAAGLLLGLWWGVRVDPSSSTASAAPARVVEALTDVVLPVLVRAGAGALAGLALGALVALTAPGLRRPAGRSR